MFFSLLMWKLKRPLFYSKMCLCQFLFLNKLEMQSCGKYSGVKAISHNIEVQWNSDWQVSICEQQQQQQGGSMPRSITDAPHIYKLKCVWGGWPTLSLLRSASLGQPNSSRLSRLPSYSRKVRYRLRKNSTCLFFTLNFFGEFQWITWRVKKYQHLTGTVNYSVETLDQGSPN